MDLPTIHQDASRLKHGYIRLTLCQTKNKIHMPVLACTHMVQYRSIQPELWMQFWEIHTKPIRHKPGLTHAWQIHYFPTIFIHIVNKQRYISHHKLTVLVKAVMYCQSNMYHVTFTFIVKLF